MQQQMFQILPDGDIVKFIETQFPNFKDKIEKVVSTYPGIASDKHSSHECLYILVNLRD